mgnify:CR=1 FL=1
MGKRVLLSLFDLILILVGIVFAILAVGGFSASYFHPAQHMELQWMGLLLPLILFVNFLLLIYWIVRKRVWFFLPLSAIVLNIPYLSAVYRCPFRKKEPSGLELNIATYNIQRITGNLFETSREIADFMETEKIDMLCLQEFPSVRDAQLKQFEEIFDFLPYYCIHSSVPGSMQVALFSRYPIIQSRQIEFPGESNHTAMWADIVVENDTIRIINNHLQTTNLNQHKIKLEDNVEQSVFRFNRLKEMLYVNAVMRSDQADIISEFIDTSPFPLIVCGDFNDTPASYTYRKIKGDLEDSFCTAEKGYGYTYRYLKKLYRIDYLLYSGSYFRATSYHSPNLEYSDHKPVIVKLDFNTKPLSQEEQIQR